MHVELRPAYEWTCEECGRSQFESAMLIELDDETKQEMIEDFGLDPDDADGEFCDMPDSVKCKFCLTEFETSHWSE